MKCKDVRIELRSTQSYYSLKRGTTFDGQKLPAFSIFANIKVVKNGVILPLFSKNCSCLVFASLLESWLQCTLTSLPFYLLRKV